MDNNKEKISKFAKELGFDLIGFSDPKVSPDIIKNYNNWLKKNYNGEMHYMDKLEERKTAQNLLEKAKTVISLATNYYHKQPEIPPHHGKIARYAFGRDYHKIISKKLKRLEQFIQEIAPNEETKSYVDTGPILDRVFAEKSGLGPVGKNSCLITQEFGSWVFLSEIITTLDLPKDENKAPGQPFSACGTCTRCMDACPTKAIIAPGVIDARRCISYLTIENKGEIPEEFREAIKQSGRLFGCDICQEVCPHNCRAKDTEHKEFQDPKIAGNSLNLKEIQKIETDQQFLQTFAGSPLMRTKRSGLQRNAKIITSPLL